MKRMYSLIAIIIAFLCFAFFRENNGFVTKQRIPKVGVLTLMHHPALDQIYKGYVDELAKEGYHNGKNIKIESENANGDQSNLKTMRSEEHTSELQSRFDLVCRLLIERKKHRSEKHRTQHHT